jgi:pyruvate,water dikinase
VVPDVATGGFTAHKQLSHRITQELIPQLEREGRTLATEKIEELDNPALATAIERRMVEVQRWRQIYRDEFVAFAHGVRRLGIYYNDAVQPKDPYEFTGLLRGEAMLASQRNLALRELASSIRDNKDLRRILQEANSSPDSTHWKQRLAKDLNPPATETFLDRLEKFEEQYMDTAFAGERLAERPDLLLSLLLELVESQERPSQEDEKTLPRALHVAAERLRKQGRLKEAHPSEKDAPILADALRKPSGEPVQLSKLETGETRKVANPGESPRQLIGQPAAPGIATGLVRTVRSAEDLARFRKDEILVCDSIQPNMTHLVPLSSAILERRGGMLIHGAIIARELGIPCVNGVPKAIEILQDGDVVTVDGFLGIVTVGAAEFELEKALSIAKIN